MSCHVSQQLVFGRGCSVSAPHVRVRQSNQLYVRLAMLRKCLFVLTCLRVGGAIGSRPVLFDCDPGVDDSLALAWLCARPDAARLVAVTTIPGNVPAHQTLSNAARLLDFFNCGAAQLGAGFDGAGKSVGFMGDDGLFGLSSQLRQEDLSAARNATEVIVDMVYKYGSELVIISVGPATNLAAAERRKPGVLAKAGEILLMGGGIRTFNAPPAPEVSFAEFNFWDDARSAREALLAAPQATVFPLDVTQQLCFRGEHLTKLDAEVGEPLHQAAWIRSAVEAMEAQNLEWGEECNYVHDVLPVGFFLESSMFETQPGRLVVDATGETPGRSVLVNTSERAKYAVKVNQSLFDHFVVDVGRYFRTRVRLQQHRDL